MSPPERPSPAGFRALPAARSAARLALLTGLLLIGAGCGGQEESAAARGPAPAVEEAALFRDVTSDVGIDFVHDPGAEGMFYFPEIMGAGLALVDYDGDGDLDLYALQGGELLAVERGSAARAPAGNRLFRNDLSIGPDERRSLRFVDVTAASGAGDTGYGMGCAVGDYDNDGDEDLYVTNHGPNVLLRNNADGTFTDVTATAGVGEERWSTSASFVDFDADGHLDLAVVNYVSFTDDVNRSCQGPRGRDYCTPLAYRPQRDTLYRNRGDGSFEDVTAAAGLASDFGNGLGVITADFDRDGRIDIYVANDMMPNQLWLNRGDGTFEDAALLAGVALNRDGAAEAGMGLAVADVDRDRDLDLFVTNLVGETNTLYVNRGDGLFDDLTDRAGLSATSRPVTGFGTAFLDFDNDGWLDAAVVNGAVTMMETDPADPFPYRMPDQLYRGLPGGGFEEVSAAAGEAFGRPESSRGLAVGDVDLDGWTDLAVSNNRGPLRVLLNRRRAGHHWLRLAVEPVSRAGTAVGAEVEIERPGVGPRIGRVRSDGSYCAASDPRVHFGLGPDPSPPSLTVTWPGGMRARWLAVPGDRGILIGARAPRSAA